MVQALSMVNTARFMLNEMKSLSRRKIFSQLLEITTPLFTHLHKVLFDIKWKRYELVASVEDRSHRSIYKKKIDVKRGKKKELAKKIVREEKYCLLIDCTCSLLYIYIYSLCFQDRMSCHRCVLDSLISVFTLHCDYASIASSVSNWRPFNFICNRGNREN
jgi:hypothetical protein